MAVIDPGKSKLPAPDKVRYLLVSDQATPEEFDRHGDLFLTAGRFDDAMFFYEKSKSKDRLDQVKTKAMESGDAFLLQWVAKIDRARVMQTDWERLGDAALAKGKLEFARQAFEKAGAGEKLDALKRATSRHVDAGPPAP
jgi:predicted negative regulator of RcsB-dependent stress response